MRELGLLIAWTLISSWSFSQTLSPQVQIIKNDTLFCFTVSQSKTIARHLANSAYCDTLEIGYITYIELLRKINSTKDNTITQLQHKINNLNSIVDNNTQSIENLNKVVEIKDKKLRRSGRHKKLLTLGLVALGVIALVK